VGWKVLEDFGADSPNWIAAAQQVGLIQSLYGGSPEFALSFLSPGEDLVEYRRNRNTWPPSWLYVRRGDDHFVVIEGSTNTYQFGIHTAGVWVREDWLGDSSVNGSWWEVTRGIQGSLPSMDSGKWHFSGHSYGGACAAMLAMELADRRGSDAVELMTFASPKYMTNGYNGPLPRPYWRIEATTDLVPSLPPAGVELVGTVWRNPLEWVRTDWFFWEYGSLIVLNTKGQVNGDLYDPGSVDAYNLIGMPNSHYLKNYWGRLNARMIRDGPPSPQLFAVMQRAKLGFDLVDGQDDVFSYPQWVPGPTGELIRIPNNWIGVNGGGEMATYMVNLVFQGANNRTWREGHAVQATTAEEAAAKLNTNSMLSARTKFLSNLYRISNVEAVNLENPRDGVIKTAGVKGSQGSGQGETAGVSWNLGYYPVTGSGQRWAPVRGFPDGAVSFNSDTGSEIIAGDVQKAVFAWVEKLADQNFGFYRRLKESNTDAALKRNYITSLNGDTTPGVTIVTCAAVVSLGTARYVTIHLRGEETSRAMPGLKGTLQPVIASSGTQLTIPYTIPRGGVVAPGQGSYMRPAVFEFVQYRGVYEQGKVYARRTRQLK